MQVDFKLSFYIGLLILYGQLVVPTYSECIESQDGDKQLWKGQHLLLQSTWLAPEGFNESEWIANSVQNQLNLPHAHDKISSTISIYNRTNENPYFFKTNITLSSKIKPERSGMLSNDLLTFLGQIIDCTVECNQTFTDSREILEFWPHVKLMTWHRHGKPALVQKLRVLLDRSITINTNECNLCEQINLIKTSFGNVPLYMKIYHNLTNVIYILDPAHWLGLFLGIWLTTCFVIAMLIKRRDKRRLRLNLEKKADYPFSTTIL